MARQARRVGPTGYYHIMMRGNNKERIFEKESDKRSLIESLKKAKIIKSADSYSWSSY